MAFVVPLDIPSLSFSILANKTLFGIQKTEVLAPGETSVSLQFSIGNNMSIDCPLCTTDNNGLRAVRLGTYLITVGGHAGNVESTSPSLHLTVNGTESVSCPL